MFKILNNYNAKQIPWLLPAGIALVGACVYLLDILSFLVKSWASGGPLGAWQFFILPILAYMLWNKRPQIGEIYTAPHFLGYSMLLLAAVAYIGAKITLFDIFLEFSILLCVAGIMISLIGAASSRQFFWPYLYLFMATSIFGTLIDKMSGFLQSVSAVVATFGLNLMGFTALQDGTFIKLPGIILEVARACSGVNQLIAMVAFAVPIAYIQLRNNALRMAVIAFAFVLTIFFNSVRILLIGIWNYSETQQSIHGPNDILLIPIIFPIALAVLYFSAFLLHRFFEKNMNEKFSPSRKIVLPTKRQILPIAIALGVFVSAPAMANLLLSSVQRSGTGEFLTPDHSVWKKIKPEKSFGVVYKYGKPDSVVMAAFSNNASDTLFFSSAYYKRQNNRNRALGNSIDMKQGLESSGLLKVRLDSGMDCIINKGRYPDGGAAVRNVYYWYTIGNATIHSPATFRKEYIKNRFLRNRSDGYFTVIGISTRRQDPDEIVRRFLAAEYSASCR